MKKILPILTVVCAVIFMFNGKKYDELVSSRLSSDVAICL
ncbi:MAG: cytochrome c5 family protein, partial [Gammaproteobacteria bacterium]|nr:cytochrome c5 family protein [Gammaproteobacteria bacterium]